MRLLLAQTTATLRAAAADLDRLGFLVSRTDTAEDLLDFALTASVEAVLLDEHIGSPGAEAVMTSLRARHPLLPIVVLAEGADRERAWQLRVAGADHVFTDRFCAREVAHRIAAMVRRSSGFPGPRIRAAGLDFDMIRREVRSGGRTIGLARLEYELLEMLALRQGQHVSRAEIMTQLYAWEDEPDDSIVEVYLSRIRRKITAAGGDPAPIETAVGRGWRLSASPRTADVAVA